MRDELYEKVLRDTRIFPIFEGANDVLRAFTALTRMKPVGEELSGISDASLADPIGSLGLALEYVAGGFSERSGRTGSRGRTRSCVRSRTRCPRRSSACVGSRSPCFARTSKPSLTVSFSRSGWPAPCRTCTRRSPSSPRHGPSRSARRRALGAGALHRRDVLSAGRSARQRRPSERAVSPSRTRARTRRASYAIVAIATRRSSSFRSTDQGTGEEIPRITPARGRLSAIGSNMFDLWLPLVKASARAPPGLTR